MCEEWDIGFASQSLKSVKLRSFRVRLALITAVLAGGALVSFGAASWWLIYNAKISRLDETLKSQLMRAGRPQRQARRQFHQGFLPRNFGQEAESVALLVVDPDNQILYRSDNWPSDLEFESLWPPQLPGLERQEPPGRLEFPGRLPKPSPLEPRFVTQTTGGKSWRIGATPFPSRRVAIAVSLDAVEREMVTIRNGFLLLIAIALLLIAVAAWFLAGSALVPIQRLTAAIRRVTVKGLDQRVPTDSTDVEFAQLIQVFNQMMESLERNFKQASRFSGDAAHELKTPLAILQGELERTLHQAEPGSPMQQRLSSLLDEVRRLSGIVRKLLLLSLADAGQMSLYRVEVNLSEILAQMEEDLELLAPHLKVKTNIAASLPVQGDRDLLVQVVQNLISNAIKYNLPGGWIKIQAWQQKARVLVTIANASKSIPLEDQARIFERFHRGDPARTRKVEGTGLGLSLSREIARAHQGDLTLDATPAGETAFTLSLPLQIRQS